MPISTARSAIAARLAAALAASGAMLVCSVSLAAEPSLEALTVRARSIAQQLVQSLGATLKQELAQRGPQGAVEVCASVAPALAGSLSREQGAKVARVSLRPRNPMLGYADAWEQEVLQSFDAQAATGTKPETLERAAIVREPAGEYFRYMKALPVQPLCLSCHGASSEISDAVNQQLQRDYPQDRAIGYRAGEIRGAVTIKIVLQP